MQKGGSLEGPHLVSASSQNRGRVALPSEQAASQQAKSPGTADQGLGSSHEPDRTAPAEAPKMQSSPSAIPTATEDANEHEKRRKSSEKAAAASGGRPGETQAASGEPLTQQQHAVLAALMVVMKRAMLEGDSDLAVERLFCNNGYTVVICQFLSNERELPSIRDLERMLTTADREMLDIIARQCTAAGFQPLHVFKKSVQCGIMAAYDDAHKRGEAAVLARHQQVAELHRLFVIHSFPHTWSGTTVKLLMRQGVPKRMATLIMLLPLLLVELCKRCFRPSNELHGNGLHYPALDHLFPGSCQFFMSMYRHAGIEAGMTSAMTHLISYNLSCN